MPVVLVPVIVLVITALVYTLFSATIVYPWLDEQFGTHHAPWWKRVALWPIHKIVDLGRQLVHRLTAHFSQILVQNEPAVSRFIHRQSVTLEHMSGVIESTAEWTHNGFIYIRHTLVPTLIERAVAPVRATANKALATATRVEAQTAQAGSDMRRFLVQLPWGVATSDFNAVMRIWLDTYVQLWHKVYRDVEKRLVSVETKVATLRDDLTPLLRWFHGFAQDSLGDIVQRLKALERGFAKIVADPTTWVLTALGLAVIPALTAGGMRTALQNLTCRNTQTVAKTICAADEAAIASLLALLFGVGLLIDPKEVARLAKDAEGILEPGIEWMAGVSSASLAEAEAEVFAAVGSFFGL